VVIVGGLALLLYKFDMMRIFMSKKRMLHFLDSLGPWSSVGFIALQALQVIVAPIPGDVTGLIGGYLYGLFLGTLLSTTGLTLGSYVAFALTRIFGKPFAEKFVPEAAMKRFEYLLHHKGLFLIFLLFLIPGFPKDYLCYILGLGDLSTMEFLVVGGAGRLFGTILLSLGGSYLRVEQYERFFILLGVAILVVLLAIAFKDKIEKMLSYLHIGSQKKSAEYRENDLRHRSS
jgi:uncharacterized membrane protein YdjX (TVP38/TMEM64 family)